jgi:TRAP-type mannitol/chloroaromatic compound transport system substrate-binding protein
MQWKSIDRYSTAYAELQAAGVAFYKTPDEILQRQLEVYDEIATRVASENPLFREILDSQIAFARRVTRWEEDTVVDRSMAINHYFGENAAADTL